MNGKNVILLLTATLLFGFFSSIGGAWIYKSYFSPPQVIHLEATPAPSFSKNTRIASPHTGFADAVKIVRPAVVHIRASYSGKSSSKSPSTFSSPFNDFFDFDQPKGHQGEATGSGVLISADGYIATNNHVIESAARLTVTLFDNRTYDAKLIGHDPNTDLALIKVEGVNFPHLNFGDSDGLQVGEWVLAVGNPMDLNSTVTAGIVSAKGRNINLLNGERGTNRGLTIESFIQTDAAVNSGNSGGALVDVNGQLVGINTAIASRTGSYAGYSFAIPATLVKKVMDDFLKYGEIRRGYLGVTILPVNADLAEDKGLSILKGAYISDIRKNSGAYQGGLKMGDVITNVEDVPVSNTSELQEVVSRYRPGDKLRMKIFRDAEQLEKTIVLKGRIGDESIAEVNEPAASELQIRGGSFRLITEEEADKLGIVSGIKVLSTGPALGRGGVQEGFVITSVNDEKIRNLTAFKKALEDSDGFVSLNGLYSRGMKASFSFSW